MVLRNDAKQESHLTRFRRSVSYYDHNQACYLHYFVGETPPTGFIDPFRYRYICQGACDITVSLTVHKGCFSTLYDTNYKIPIYAAYVLRPLDWNGIGDFTRNRYGYWQKETGPKSGERHLYVVKSKIPSTTFYPCLLCVFSDIAATKSFP